MLDYEMNDNSRKKAVKKRSNLVSRRQKYRNKGVSTVKLILNNNSEKVARILRTS